MTIKTKKRRNSIHPDIANAAWRTWLRANTARGDDLLDVISDDTPGNRELRSALTACGAYTAGGEDDVDAGWDDVPSGRFSESFTFDLVEQPKQGPERRAMSHAKGGDGGYLVSPGLVGAYEVALRFSSAIRQLATVVRKESGEPYLIPTVDDTANEGVIIGENTSSDLATLALGQVKIYDRKFASGIAVVPSELLDDADQLGDFLARILAERIGRIQNRHWTGKLLGAATLGRTATSTTAIAYEDVVELIHSVDPAYRANGSFMCHDDIILSLREVVDMNDRPVLMDGEGREPTVLGFPVVPNMHMASAAVSGAKTLSFGDHSRFTIRDIRDVNVRRYVERYRDTDQDGFCAFHRAEGELVDAGTGPVKYLQH